jgi:protocatechuate 3,4-dioxygenase beta subunit
MPDPSVHHRRQLLGRREALLTLGAGIGAIYGLRGLLHAAPAAGASCVLQREVTEGPYYLDLDLLRRDIRSGRPGTPMTLRLKVVDATTCRPIRNATVDIWHCDASGAYSGVSGNRGNFLRGIQRADAAGNVRFDTIVPGWYRGRTPHIHVKVFVSGHEVHTGQVFFRAAVLRAIYAQGAYASRGQADTSNASDGIYRAAGPRSLLTLRRRGTSVSGGYTGSLTLGVKRS